MGEGRPSQMRRFRSDGKLKLYLKWCAWALIILLRISSTYSEIYHWSAAQRLILSSVESYLILCSSAFFCVAYTIVNSFSLGLAGV